MASKKELTVRIDANLIEAAEEYAREHNTTLQNIISDFLNRLATAQSEMPPSTVLDRLAGILPPDVSAGEHKKALTEKYLDRE